MKTTTPSRFALVLATLFLLMHAPACQRAYYGTWEALGVHKREILVDRVEDARDGQQEAQQQFASALEQFKSVVQVESGDLEAKYETLRKELTESERKAATVRGRIEDIEDVADALFAEWNDELQEYSTESFRNASEKQMTDTKDRYETMITAMRKAEQSMDPVLDAFRDQVLFLKHNLNARAIASIQDTADDLETDIEALIEEMQRSIDEANEFIEAMGLNPTE